ncbi:MAG TPA: sulfite exporter TauE/SafE family protein [Thermoleophilaceae bacterium]|jgi:hypothetical protein
MDASEVCLAVGIGVAGGLVSGMLGIGGGLVFIPGFTLLLGMSIHTAAGTSLLTMAITTSAGAWRHHAYGRVNVRDAFRIGLVAPIGVVVGVTIAQGLPERELRFAVACVMVYSGGALGRRALGPLAASGDQSPEQSAPPPPPAPAPRPRDGQPGEPPRDRPPRGTPTGLGSHRPPVVIGLGLEPLRLLEGQGRIDCVLETPTQAEVPVLVDLLEAGVAAGGGVVAIVPDWFPAAGRASFALARRTLDDPLIAVHRTPCPPLQAAVLAACASALGGRMAGPGLVASVLRAVERRLFAVAWLGTVTGLSEPKPPWALRLLSPLPGQGFVVLAAGESASVHRARAGRHELQLDPAAAVAVSARRAEPGRLTAAFPQLAGLPSVAVAPTPAGPLWWGTGRLVEAVVYPRDPERLAVELLRDAARWDCSWCGQPVAVSPCPCCGRAARPREAAAAPRTAELAQSSLQN